MKILFVCLGNICRSPMAHAYMRQMIVEKKALDYHVDSCGTGSWHEGEPPHEGTLAVLEKAHISTDNLYARPLTFQDFQEFDVIIGMDKANVSTLKSRAPQGTLNKIHLFLDILEDKKGQDVPDPWYTHDFETTQQLISKGVTAWFNAISSKDGR